MSPLLHRRSSEGMTLIEIMIAVAIMAIVTTVVYSGFSQTTKTQERVVKRSERQHAVQQTLSRMVREIEMAYVSVHFNPSETLQTMRTTFACKDKGDSDRLDMTAFSHVRLYRGAKESDQEELSYFLIDDPEKPGTQALVRREQRRIDDKPEQGGTLQILLHEVESLDFKFLDPMSHEWVSAWDAKPYGEQPNRLPSQVKITLKLAKTDAADPVLFVSRAVPKMRFALNHAVYAR